MKQYLLSVYQPDGDAARARGARADHARPAGPQRGDEGRRRLGLPGGLHPPSTATVVRSATARC